MVQALAGTRIHIDETLVGRGRLERPPRRSRTSSGAELDPHLAVLHDAGGVPSSHPDGCARTGSSVRWWCAARPRRFSDETCELLEAFASQSTIALTNARLYQQLERQSAELAEASQHKSEFLASMSHELRTPLNAVIGFSEVLLERMFGDLNERQEDYLRDILSAGRHLLALLNDVLDLSKVEAGHMELDPTEFAVADAVDYALSMVRERAIAHGIDLRRDVGPSVDQVRADELRFKQVLLNLLSNAVKFTPDGAGSRCAPARVDGDLEVTASDTGMGIAPEDQAADLRLLPAGRPRGPQGRGHRPRASP